MAIAIISRLREIRESSLQRRTLWREIADCDPADLQAALARTDEAASEEVFGIISAQRALESNRY